ncbi:MAG: hypothetical protein JXQ99_21645 [Hyphomicrobiaceae bacterium]
MIHKTALVALCTTILVGGCATVEDRIADYRHLNCAELNQKIGKFRYIREEAQRDGLISDVVGIVGNKKQRKEADVDSLVASIEEDGADTDLEALRTLKRHKQCE